MWGVGATCGAGAMRGAGAGAAMRGAGAGAGAARTAGGAAGPAFSCCAKAVVVNSIVDRMMTDEF